MKPFSGPGNVLRLYGKAARLSRRLKFIALMLRECNSHFQGNQDRATVGKGPGGYSFKGVIWIGAPVLDKFTSMISKIDT